MDGRSTVGRAIAVANGACIVEVVESEAGLGALAEEWNALFEACERPSACASHAWVVAWWEAFGANPLGAGAETALFVAAIRNEAGALVGALPMFEERGAFRVRRLRSVGFLGREGVYDMTEEPAVLIRPGWEARVLRAVAETLRPDLLRGRWDLVFLNYLAQGSADALGEAFRGLHPLLPVRTERRTGPYVAELPASWAAYRKTLSKSMRDNLGYYPRLLTRDGHDWSVRILREPSAMREASERLAALHGSRARNTRGRRHHDHIHGPAQRAFLAELLRRLAETGKAFVAELTIDGNVVASQAFVETDGELMVYYSGYDEAWYKYSPVFVIEGVVFRDALERGVRRLNFLRARAKWKARWGAADGLTMHRAFVVPLRPDCWFRLAIYLADILYRRDVVARIPRLRRKWASALRKALAHLAPSRSMRFARLRHRFRRGLGHVDRGGDGL